MSAASDPRALAVRVWQPGEARELVPFEPAPGEPEPLFRPRDAAEWDWAFARNAAGARLVLARRGGRAVARCAGLAVRTSVFGEPRTFAQLLDGGLAHAAARGELDAAGVEPEYLELRSTTDLSPAERVNGSTLLAVAARVGRARLIDNTVLKGKGTQ